MNVCHRNRTISSEPWLEDKHNGTSISGFSATRSQSSHEQGESIRQICLPPTWNTITVLKLWSRHAVRPRAGASTSVLLPLATTKWTGILINASTGLNQGSSHSEFFWRINLLVDGADPLAEVKQATQHVRHSSAHSGPTFKISFWWIRLRFDQWSSCGTHHADLEVSFSSLKYQFVNSWTCSLRRNLISHWHQCAQQHVSLRWFLYSWWWIY